MKGTPGKRSRSNDAYAAASPVQLAPGKRTLVQQRYGGAPSVSSPAEEVPQQSALVEANGAEVAGGAEIEEDAPDLAGSPDAIEPAGPRKESGGSVPTDKAHSARFDGDKKLEDVAAGVSTVERGGRGVQVTKVQQALIDLGYKLPKYGVDGKFEGETKAAVVKFQNDNGLAPTGALDKDTLAKLDAIYDTRKPYIDAAKHDAAHPGTRTLSGADRADAIAAMVPPVGAGGAPAVFTDVVGGKAYGDEIRDRLQDLVKAFHKELFEDKEPLRADPAKNFHAWSTMEGPAKAAKQVTDTLYDSNYGGAAAFPAMTHAGGNLVDQWEDEVSRNAALSPAQKKAKATEKVWYLIDSNCAAINHRHGAVPSKPTEHAILQPIVDSFVATAAKVQTMLELDIGWEGAQLEGVVYLQRYKSTNADAAKAKDENRIQMWDLFQTCIHEYIHTLAHADYIAWAQTFSAANDNTRYNTLVEGFCDFFTLNVRKAMAIDATIQGLIEGPYANGKAPAPDRSGVYPSHAQAEQVVSIVGIKNAQRAYFGGKTAGMGGP